VNTVVVASSSPEQPVGEGEGNKNENNQTTTSNENKKIDRKKVSNTFNGIPVDSIDNEQDTVIVTAENSNSGEDIHSGEEVSSDSVVDLSEEGEVEEGKDTTIIV